MKPASYQASQETSIDTRNDPQWQSLCNELISDHQVTNVDKGAILKARTIKFFTHLPVSPDEHSVPRREVGSHLNPLLRIEEATLVLYGVQLLKQQDIMKYFSPFCLVVSFLDESHCSVKFQSSTDLIHALFSKLNSDIQAELSEFEASLSKKANQITWIQICSYKYMDFTKDLWARFMTNLDTLNTNSNHQNIIKELEQAKNRLVLEAHSIKREEKGKNRSRSRDDISVRQRQKRALSKTIKERSACMCHMVRDQKHFWDKISRMLEQGSKFPVSMLERPRGRRGKGRRGSSSEWMDKELTRLRSQREVCLHRRGNGVPKQLESPIDFNVSRIKSREEEERQEDETSSVMGLVDQLERYQIGDPAESILLEVNHNDFNNSMGKSLTFEDYD